MPAPDIDGRLPGAPQPFQQQVSSDTGAISASPARGGDEPPAVTFRVVLEIGKDYGLNPFQVRLSAATTVPHFRALPAKLCRIFGRGVWTGLALDEDEHERDWVREVRQADGRWVPITACATCDGVGDCLDGSGWCATCHGTGYLLPFPLGCEVICLLSRSSLSSAPDHSGTAPVDAAHGRSAVLSDSARSGVPERDVVSAGAEQDTQDRAGASVGIRGRVVAMATDANHWPHVVVTILVDGRERSLSTAIWHICAAE